MRSDQELLEAWKAGDGQAGSELLGRYFPLLYRFFRNKTGIDTEDLIQQTLLSCVRQKESFRGDCSFRTFVLRVARSRLYDHLRARSRQPGADLSVTSVVDLGMRVSAQFARDELQRAVADGLRTLPVEVQVALELHYWDELSGREIAEVLEIPEGTVRGRLRRGKQLLRKELARRLSATPAFDASALDLVRCLGETRLSLDPEAAAAARATG